MYPVNFIELHQRSPERLKQVPQGEDISITLHGKTFALNILYGKEN
ncbi:hypothetical protein RP726_10515 [Candidatus Methylospira mobilis]|nr:hypothetical protein [Candidatus Methylospira mobilis]WNV02914.1 hypothetical protein RP726_10515 [Candidatus Methylospira mobilis]